MDFLFWLQDLSWERGRCNRIFQTTIEREHWKEKEFVEVALDETRVIFCSVLAEQLSKVRSTKRLKIKVSDDSSHFFSFFFRNIMESTEEEKER